MSNGEHYTEEAFKQMSPETRDYLIYGKILNMEADCEKRFGTVCGRVDKLESRKKIDTGIGAGSGFIGGVIATFAKKIFMGG